MKDHQQNNSSPANMQLWYCQGCQQVHLRATNIALDFTRREFVSLGSAVLDILGREFTPEEISELPLIVPAARQSNETTSEVWPEELFPNL